MAVQGTGVGPIDSTPNRPVPLTETGVVRRVPGAYISPCHLITIGLDRAQKQKGGHHTAWPPPYILVKNAGSALLRYFFCAASRSVTRDPARMFSNP